MSMKELSKSVVGELVSSNYINTDNILLNQRSIDQV
jgi:hypothetical protein